MGNFSISKTWTWFSELCGIRVYQNFGAISWEFNFEIFAKESFGVGFQFLKNELKTHIWGVFGVTNHVIKKFRKIITFRGAGPPLKIGCF